LDAFAGILHDRRSVISFTEAYKIMAELDIIHSGCNSSDNYQWMHLSWLSKCSCHSFPPTFYLQPHCSNRLPRVNWC